MRATRKPFPSSSCRRGQPKRILWNGRGGENNTNEIHLEISGNDPVLGISFAELAARSRAMHKTQGFDNFRGGGGNGPRTEPFQLLAGEPATNDIMDGVDTTWNRVPGGAEIGKEADEIIAKFDPQNPSASVDALLALKKNLAGLATEPLVEEKRKLLDKILQACLGLSVTTTVPQAEVVPGEELDLNFTVNLASSWPVHWKAIRFPATENKVAIPDNAPMGNGVNHGNFSFNDVTQTLPVNTPLSQPYWLREDPTPGMFRVADARLIGQPENPPEFPVEYIFQVGDQTLVISDEPVQAGTESGKFEARRTLKVIPPVSLHCEGRSGAVCPGFVA